jgi:hypothetical protein
VPVSDSVWILEQSLFLLSQFVLVCLAWVATEIAFWVAAVHGMMLDQSMRLFDVLIIESSVALCNFDLFGNGIVILLLPTTHFGFVLLGAHVVPFQMFL